MTQPIRVPFHFLPFHRTQVHLTESCVGSCSQPTGNVPPSIPSASPALPMLPHPLPPPSSPLFHSSIYSENRIELCTWDPPGISKAGIGRFADWGEMINLLPVTPLPEPWLEPTLLVQSSKWQEGSRTGICTLEFQIGKLSQAGYGGEGQKVRGRITSKGESSNPGHVPHLASERPLLGSWLGATQGPPHPPPAGRCCVPVLTLCRPPHTSFLRQRGRSALGLLPGLMLRGGGGHGNPSLKTSSSYKTPEDLIRASFHTTSYFPTHVGVNSFSVYHAPDCD